MDDNFRYKFAYRLTQKTKPKMKAKFLMFMMVVGMLFALPSLSYAQPTEENIEFEGSDAGNSDFGPVSLDPVLVNGVLSHANQTLKLNILFDLGKVDFVIMDENGNVYLRKEVNSSEEAQVTLDLTTLPAQKYTIVCYTSDGNVKAEFELY